MPVALFCFGLIVAVLTLVSHRPPQRFGTLALAVWMPGWLLSELPFHALVVHAIAVALLIGDGGLDAPLGWAGLGLAGLSALGLLQHIRLALRTEHLIDDALTAGLGADHAARAARTPIPASPSTSLWSLALVWPFRPRTVERTRNLTYHRSARRELRLDVYRATDPAHRRDRAPVFVYVHGGAWVIGNKGQQGRLTVHRLAALGWVCVSINYRLSPWATFPDHIIDVKRALRWVREHIAEHGGDPEFVVIGGGSAGAHLASLAALTPNALEYQRDFPDVDTAVQGCVAYYGVYDFSDRDRSFRHRAFRNLLLERVVMKRRFADAPEEFEKASPRWRLGEHAPPFFIVHGDRDSLAPLTGAHRFRDDLRKVTGAPVVWTELPGAQHAFEVFPSVRAAAVVRGVARFCDTIHADWQARSTSVAVVNGERATSRAVAPDRETR